MFAEVEAEEELAPRGVEEANMVVGLAGYSQCYSEPRQQA